MDNTIHKINLILNALTLTADIGSEIGEKIDARREYNKHKHEFSNALKEKGYNKITEESTALYATNGLLSREALHVLRDANIPCLAFSNDKDDRILVAVPMQYSKHADRILDTLNLRSMSSQISSEQFAKINLGQKIVEHTNLTDEQVQLLGQKLMGTGVGYCVVNDKQHSGPSNENRKIIRVNEERSEIVNRAVMEVRMMTRTQRGQHELERMTEQREALRTALGQSRGNADVFIADMQRDGSALMYRITNNDLFRVENGVSSRVIQTNDPQFEATLGAAILKMQHPMIKTCPAKTKNGNYVENIYTREEIIRAKERLANDDRENGRADAGDALASQIVGMCVSQPGAENAAVAQALHDVASFSKTCVITEVAEYNRAGIAELYDRYQKLSLTPDEDEAVLQHAQECYHEYQDLMYENVVTEQDLSLDDISAILDRDNELGGYDFGRDNFNPVGEFDDISESLAGSR